MKIIKQSPLDFNFSPAKTGSIYWDDMNNLFIYWESGNQWQYIPEALARSWETTELKLQVKQKENDSLAQALKSALAWEKEQETALNEYKIVVADLERQLKDLAQSHSLLIRTNEELTMEADVALPPEDIAALRGTCTVDEILRMREAGVL